MSGKQLRKSVVGVGPMRTCVGCRTVRPKGELLRLTVIRGRVAVDPSGRASGRGAYLCYRKDCVADAVKRKAVERALRLPMAPAERERLRDDLSAAIEKGGVRSA